jgi:hypothetical protein
MKLWKIALFALIAIVASCGTYTKQPVASHVLAVTLEGDTILVAIDRIRPNQYINFYPVYGGSYYQSYYNPYYSNQYMFRYPDNRGFRTSNENNNNNNNNVKPRPIVESKDISRLDVNAAKVKMKN